MPTIRSRFILVFCGVFICTSFLSAGNWPRFRGPNGTGIVDDKLPAEWSKENILWKIALPGDGNSSPVIWQNRLFLQSAGKDGSRLLLCLSAKDGKILWTKAIAGQQARKHAKNSYASSTPAVDGERVYASFWDGKDIILTAHDFNGKEVWRKNLGAFKSQHGPGASPIVIGDKIVFYNDQDGNFNADGTVQQDDKSLLVALDAKTGEIVWQKQRPPYRSCYGSPFVWQREKGKTELVVISTNEFTGYDPNTGKVNWRWPWKHFAKRPLRVTGSPIFADKTIFGASGDGGGDRYMVAVNVNGNGKNVTPKLAWSNKKDFPYVPTMLAYKGLLYFTNDYGVAGCYNAKTGDSLWNQRISDVAFTASPIIADGKIYAANEDGDVFVISATPAFQVLARNSLGERVRATPAVADNRLYVRGQRHLFCIGNVEEK